MLTRTHKRHSIGILRAGYIERDEDTKYPRQRWTVSIKDNYAYQGNRCWQNQQRHSIEILLSGYIGRDEDTKYPRQRWTVNIKDNYAYQGNRCWQRSIKNTRSVSYGLDTQKEMRTQSIHDKDEQLVSRTITCIKATDVDKDPWRHSIEILHAGYIGIDEDTKYPRQRWTVSIKDNYVYQGNRCWQRPMKTLDRNLTSWIHRKRWGHSIHDKCEQLVPRTIMRIKALHIDKDT